MINNQAQPFPEHLYAIDMLEKEYYNRAYNSQQPSPFSDGDNQ